MQSLRDKFRGWRADRQSRPNLTTYFFPSGWRAVLVYRGSYYWTITWRARTVAHLHEHWKIVNPKKPHLTLPNDVILIHFDDCWGECFYVVFSH